MELFIIRLGQTTVLGQTHNLQQNKAIRSATLLDLKLKVSH